MLSGHSPTWTPSRTLIIAIIALGSVGWLSLQFFVSPPVSDGPANRMTVETRQTEPVPSTAVFAGVSVAWMLPALPKLTDQRSIRTVLLLFHGCTHHGMDWFTYPEERIVVNAALRLNYAVVSFTSQDRDSGCWSGELPASQNAELHMVATAYSQLINTIASQAVAAGWTWNSDEMKVIALGGSSGGTFVSILPHALSLAGIAMYVSPGHPEVIAPPSRSSSLCRTSVQNVVFVYMPRDTAWASQSAMEHAERVLSSSECGKTVTVHAVAPKPITVELLVDRIAVIQATPTLAHTIVAALPLDHGGYLTQDPRRISVETIVKLAANKHLPSAHVDVLVLTAHVREILSMCYAVHEYTSEGIHQVLRELVA